MGGVVAASFWNASLRTSTPCAVETVFSVSLQNRRLVIACVTITLSDDLKEFFDAYYTGGAWVEGFTYVIPITETDDGEELGVQHSIPILGFYGSFTDASMFDCVSAIDTAYGTLKESYTGNDETNYLTVNYGAKNSIFMGNPYTVEDEFPADRLAINSDTDLVNIKYNLIRNAASVGWLAYDEDGELLDNGNFATNVNSAYYHVNKGVWMDTGIRTAILNTSAGKLGLNEGDTFTIGLFAVPEYYGMQLHPGENDATVTPDEILSLRDSGELGAGSFLGYTFLVDNENPKITEVRLSDDKTEVAITAQDDNYVAFIAIADLLGNVIYVGTVPEQDAPGEEVTVTFDISDLGLDGAVAAFVGDYAANEDASLIRLSGEGTVPVTVTETHEIYKPATSIENGRDYLIVSTSNTGTVQAMKSNGAQSYVSNQAVTVKQGTLGDYTGKYIEVDSVTDSIRWIASTEANGFSLMCLGNGTYLGATSNGSKPGCFDDTEPYNYVSNQLACLNYYTVNVYITWSRNNFIVNYPNKPTTKLYIYVRDEYTETYVVDVDPENASEVTVNPDDLLMIVGETAKLRATVSPMVLSDKSVTWRSEDENVATVDANGVVTAVGAGETEIVATSNVTPTVSGSAHVKVLAPEPMDAVIYGQLAFGDDDVQFASIDLNDMSTENLSGDNVFSYFYGGAQSGDYIYGNDIDNDFHSYSGEDYTYDSFWHDVWEVINANFALLDGASIPNFTYLNMDDLDDDGNPAEVEFTTNVVGFCPAGYLLFYDEGGMDTLSGYGLSDYGNFVAITFAGLEQNDDGTLSFYYYGLSDVGDLWIFLVDAEIADGEADYGLRLGNLGPIVGLDMSKDKTAYSMAYAGGVLEEEGVFIADNTIGGIYYVPVDFDADEQELHFVGRIDGVTNLSTLFDNDYDAIGDLGAIKISTKSGDSVGDEYRASVFAREFLMDREVLAIERINPFDEIEEILDPYQDYEIVDLDPIDEVIDTEIDDGDVIEISGGLNAVGARTVVETRKTLSKLDSGALINPEYNDDGYTIIAMTTPNFGQEDTSYDVDYYNGFLTLNYDPVFLEYQSVEIVADVTLTSYSVDTQNGVIKLAYASLTPIEGEAVIANVQFSAPSDDTVVTVTTTEANDDLSVGEVTEIELEGPGYIVTVMDYTKLGATIDLDTEILHKGETTFTVEADQAVAVIVKDGPFTRNAVDWDEEDYRYTTIDCVDENGAHTFTIDVKQNLTICLVYKGDVNLNGVLETKDGTMIKRAAVGTYDLTDPLMRLVADVDNNGTIQTKDGQQVARAVVGTWEIPW